jgi:hypothetical protein
MFGRSDRGHKHALHHRQSPEFQSKDVRSIYHNTEKPLKYSLIALALSSLTIASFSQSAEASEYRSIRDIPFEDPQFLTCLLKEGHDDPALIEGFNCWDTPITSIDETRCFPNLTGFVMTGTRLHSLNANLAPKLVTIGFDADKLDHLDVTGLPDLKILSIEGATFSTIDLSKNLKLERLDLPESKVETLDLSHQTLLDEIVLWDAPLKTLVLGSVDKLTDHQLAGTQVHVLDLSGASKLSELGLPGTSLDTLATVDTSALEFLMITDADLSDTEISTLIDAPKNLGFANAQLGQQNWSKLNQLSGLVTLDSTLDDLDLSGFVQLKFLRVLNTNLDGVRASDPNKFRRVDMDIPFIQ